jgi:hypothetical protein
VIECESIRWSQVKLLGRGVRLLIPGLFALSSCKVGTPPREELDRLIDERLAERGLVALPAGSTRTPLVSSAVSVEAPVPQASAGPDPNARLDELAGCLAKLPVNGHDQSAIERQQRLLRECGARK